MARLNTQNGAVVQTHEGAQARRITAELGLRRVVMACMLWEKQFYVDGVAIADCIAGLVPRVDAPIVAQMAIEAREQMKLRHVPLLIVAEMTRHDSHRGHVAETLTRVIQRPDEMAEYLAIYWRDGKRPISNQSRKGLAAAFRKFDEYQLAKWRGKGNAITLRDVMFLVHPEPKDAAQAALFKRIADDELTTPDTWEVSLSASGEETKREKWERMLREKRLGALALLRNLRNMQQENVDESLVLSALQAMSARRVLPFRFIAAARHAPQWEPQLETKLFESVAEMRLSGRTVVLVDVSGSMDASLSSRSDMTRMDAACGVAMLAREMCEQVTIATFSNQTVRVPARRGFALRDAIVQSQPHLGTYLGSAVAAANSNAEYDRLIVITDEQSHDPVPHPNSIGYMINVASYQNGVGYGAWVHVDGWSESVLHYLIELERQAKVTHQLTPA